MQKFFLIALAAGLCAAVAVAEFRRGTLWFNMPTQDEFPVRGVDVSHHQGKIDWMALRGSGIRFAYIKATEGGDFVDPDFARNWTEAESAGIARGAYHFFTLCRSGEEQARHFLRTVRFREADLPLVADLEYSGNCSENPRITDVTREVDGFLRAIDGAAGRKTTIYTTYDFFRTNLNASHLERDVWIRDVFFEPRGVFKDRYRIWQYSMVARLPGIKGRVDMNAFRGSTGDFAAWMRSAK